MRMNKGKGRAALGICVGMLAVHAAGASAAIGGGTPVAIDTFGANQSALTLTFPPAGTSASSSASGSGILGGERDLQVSLTGGVIAGSSMSGVVSSGFFSYTQDATIAGHGDVVWDGVDGSSALGSGLGDVDLTAGGTQDALDLAVFFDDLPVATSLTVHSPGGGSATATFTMPGLLFSSDHFVVPFSSFVQGTTPADFTDVTAMSLDIGSTTTSPDVVVDGLTTDALVRAATTATLSTDGGGDGVAGAGDELTYTTTIANPADQSGASSAGTALAFPAPAGTTLVTGSVATTRGAVTDGNGAGDGSVDVDLGSVPDGGSATVTARFTVGTHPPSPITAQGTVTSDSLTALETDDPAAGGGQDPTTVPAIVDRGATAADDGYDAVGTTPLTTAAPGVLANDADADGDPLTAAVGTAPAHGHLTLNADGSFAYTADDGYVGTDTFTYVANDGMADSAPATVQVRVAAPPPPPAPPVDTTPPAATPAPVATPAAPATPTPAAPTPRAACMSRRSVTLALPRSAAHAKRVTVRVGKGQAQTVAVRHGKVTVSLRGAPAGRYTVRISLGKKTLVSRSYSTCRAASGRPVR
jgi:VCBS repeat-containing protein